jgi:hypothetical protein
MAIQVAALLGMDPAYVLACAAAERTKRRDVKLAWQGAARRLAPAAWLLAITAAAWTFCQGESADTLLIAFTTAAVPMNNALHIICMSGLLALSLLLVSRSNAPHA